MPTGQAAVGRVRVAVGMTVVGMTVAVLPAAELPRLNPRVRVLRVVDMRRVKALLVIVLLLAQLGHKSLAESPLCSFRHIVCQITRQRVLFLRLGALQHTVRLYKIGAESRNTEGEHTHTRPRTGHRDEIIMLL